MYTPESGGHSARLSYKKCKISGLLHQVMKICSFISEQLNEENVATKENVIEISYP